MSDMLRAPLSLALLLSLALAGCGGGGGTSTTGGGGGGSSGSASPNPQGPSSSFAQQCAANNTLAAAGLRSTTLDTEKKWLRAYVDEAYLWRDEVPTVDPSASAYSGSDAYAAIDNYFEALKTQQLTDTGQRRDRFSFTYPTDKWNALSSSGQEAGYGIEWRLASTTPPRQIRVAYVEPGSPAERAGVMRGDELVSADNYSADVSSEAGVDGLNAAMYPEAANAAHSFVFSRTGSGTLTRSLTSAIITKTPVPQARVLNTPQGKRAGYLVFHDHIASAEQPLIDAMRSFQQQGVSELVLDLRYNGGGYLYLASELAYMIAGAARTGSQAFETLRYNARRSADNRITPFFGTSCLLVGNRCTQEQPLPALNLSRVYVLAQSGTCSASEAVINGLRGVGVEVVLIGGKTCGKPYGFTAKDNCGISYFPIEFSGVNAQGFGDYADGFEPTASGTTGTRFVKGCNVADDFSRALGDTGESLLASALGHADTGSCPVLPGVSSATARAQGAWSGEGGVALSPRRHPARDNRIWVAR